MTLEEIKDLIKTMQFADSSKTVKWNFIYPNTIDIIGPGSFTKIHYEIIEKNGRYLLDHKGQLGSENLIIEIDNKKSGLMKMALVKELSNKLFLELIQNY